VSVGRSFALIVAAALVVALALGVAGGVALWTADATVKRVQGANGQLEVLHDLDGATGRYGRQVANQFLFGYDRPGALQTARNEMQRNLSALARATRAELDVVSGREELQGQLPELERVRRMTDLFYAIDKAATQAFALAERGAREEGLEVLNRQVNFSLSNELQPLIDQAIADERRDVAERMAAFAALRGTITLWAGIAAALALAALAAIAALGWRSYRRQLAGLTGRLESALHGVAAAPAGPPERGFGPLPGVLDAAAAALATARARQAGAEARLMALDSERSAFLADVGHQLRTPLTVIRGEADVALRGTVTESSLRQSMERVRTQAAELVLLLEELLAAVRQGTEVEPAAMSEIALGDVAAAAASEGKVLADPREVTIVVERPAAPLVVAGNFQRLKQALMIGLDNAVKHAPPGSTITIGAARTARGAVLSIADEGPGVPAEDQPNLFRRFYRGRQENELLNTGFGLGLAIARQVAEQHGGTASLGNRATGGALFEIVLPPAEGGAR
jgi:signal transduction histidine kinase